jgi:hypothetical protein
MDELSTEKKRAIVRLVFPDLRFGGDPDIERYFELRKEGKIGRALAVYNGALRARYPDDAARVVLLKLYRENDPRYSAYQDSLVLDFASRLSARIRANIDLIVAPLEKADLSDALRALKAVESVLARLPGETESALELLYRYEKFSQALGHREVLVGRALELVREYDAVSRADSPSDYDFVARSAAIEERRKALSRRRSSARPASASGAVEENYDFVSRSASLERRRRRDDMRAHNFFDPDRIKFSEADKARVEISHSLTRREDRVLAFCAKYWPRAADAAFERVVFLYSRKFGGRHFEVFRAIKLGRARGATDDEMLSSVAAILTTSYSYSVSGDLYMQIMWRRYRARMEAQVAAERSAAPGPESKIRPKQATPERPERPAPATVAPRSVEPGLRSSARAPTLPKGGIHAPPEKAVAAPTAAVPAAMATHAGSAVDRALPARVAERQMPKEPSLRPSAKAKGARLLVRAPAGPEPVREIRGKGGSISDSIKKLSGRTYDVYKELFLVKIRDHIHKYLVANQTKGHSLFDTAANDAEDQVYGFVTAHYDDPFMDWEHSAERDAVETLGFSLPSLTPIIESCFKKL